MGYELQEIRSASKKPARRTRAHKLLLHPAAAPQGLHATLRGMVLPHWSHPSANGSGFGSGFGGGFGGSPAPPRRGSLAKSRVDELEDPNLDAVERGIGGGWHRQPRHQQQQQHQQPLQPPQHRHTSDAPPKPGRRRGSLTTESTTSPLSPLWSMPDAASSSFTTTASARARSMRRWSSDQNLTSDRGDGIRYAATHHNLHPHALDSEPPRRPVHRRDSFASSSNSNDASSTTSSSSHPVVQDPLPDNGEDFWSRLKDSSPASPQPAQRRGSVQDLEGIAEWQRYLQERQAALDDGSNVEATETSSGEPDRDMLHHYCESVDAKGAVAATTAACDDPRRRRSSFAGAIVSTSDPAPPVTPEAKASRRWSLRGNHKGLDASPRPGYRRSSMARKDGSHGGRTTTSVAAAAAAAAAEAAAEAAVVKAEAARPRRRSSFFGGGGGGSSSGGSCCSRDSLPAPTERRSSLGNATPTFSSTLLTATTSSSAVPGSATSTAATSTTTNTSIPLRGGPPVRRRSFLGGWPDLPQWSPAKSDRDETESSTAVSVASSSVQELRRQMEPSSLLGTIPDLDGDRDDWTAPQHQPQPQLPRRRSFLGGFREGATASTSAAQSTPSVATTPAGQAPVPRRRSSFLGSFRESSAAPTAPETAEAAAPTDDSVRSHSSSGRSDGPPAAAPLRGEGPPARRRASLLGSILSSRDASKSIAAV